MGLESHRLGFQSWRYMCLGKPPNVMDSASPLGNGSGNTRLLQDARQAMSVKVTAESGLDPAP